VRGAISQYRIREAALRRRRKVEEARETKAQQAGPAFLCFPAPLKTVDRKLQCAPLAAKRFPGARKTKTKGRTVFLSFRISVFLIQEVFSRWTKTAREDQPIGWLIRGMDQVALHFRILVADDHSSFRHLLRGFLELNPNWEVCGEASDGWEAVVRTTELNPDIVIMDLDMPKMNGFEATRRIRETSPGTRILILTLHEFSTLAQIAQDSGAQGLVFKSEPFEVLTDAIETLGNTNEFFVSPHHE
jgi:CheY-like chemotaxis protein